MYCILSITLITIFYLLANNNFKYHPISPYLIISRGKYSKSIFSIQRLYSLVGSSSDTCKWTFDHYSPSSWEKYWYNNISTFKNNICPILIRNDQLNKSIITIQYIINSQKTIANQSFSSEQYDALLSKMYYRYQCSDLSEPDLLVSQYIEPLIGMLRDPLTICTPPAIPPTLVLDYENAVQSKRFFLLGPSAAYQNFKKPITSIVPWLSPPGSQKILFDLGSSYFFGMSDASTAGSSSAIGTRWFYEYFRSHSLRLDRIIAFEASQYTPHTYWKQIPDDVIGLLTFINTGVENAGKFNPWNILKSIAKVEDYVIIKLDIDTFALENELANQVLNDSSIHSLIDEMFFEMHVTINEMKNFWGAPPGGLEDSYTLFTKLRELGIRMHSWP